MSSTVFTFGLLMTRRTLSCWSVSQEEQRSWPSAGDVLPVYQHCSVSLPEAPFHLLPMSGPGVAVLYFVVPPAGNPLIYSMRTEELKDAFTSVIPWTFANSNKINTSLHKWFPDYLIPGFFFVCFFVCCGFCVSFFFFIVSL